MRGGKERGGEFRIAGGDPPPSLEMQEGVFHQVPQFVEFFVIAPLLLPVSLGRDLRFHPLSGSLPDDRVGVVPLIGQQIFRRQPLDEFASLRTICRGTCRDKYSDRHTMRIHGQVQLGVEPPFVTPISWLPPLAPVA